MELKIYSVVYATKNGLVAADLRFTVRQHNLCTTSRHRLREVCGCGMVFKDFFFGGGGLRIVMELYRRFILLPRLWDGCGLLNPFGDFPSAINNVRPALGGAAAAARRRHGLEVEDEGHLKDLVVIFVFVEVSRTARCFF